MTGEQYISGLIRQLGYAASSEVPDTHVFPFCTVSQTGATDTAPGVRSYACAVNVYDATNADASSTADVIAYSLRSAVDNDRLTGYRCSITGPYRWPDSDDSLGARYQFTIDFILQGMKGVSNG